MRESRRDPRAIRAGRFVATVLGVLFSSVGDPAFAYDSEWPPEEDVSFQNQIPAPGLGMGEVSISIPDEFGDWFDHRHDVGGWMESPLWFTFGDLEGQDDGDLDVLIVLSNEALLAARVDIDWSVQPPTGTLTPLWFWLTDYAVASGPQGLNGVPPGDHDGTSHRNALIWDLDGDGENEVVVRAKDHDTGHAPYPGISVLKADPDPGSGPWLQGGTAYSVPPPLRIAKVWMSSGIGMRLGLARMRDAALPMDIVTHEHAGRKLDVWRLNGSSLDLVYEFDAALTWNTQGVLTHEYNWADVDGDGFDEFALDGIVDFVDAGVGGAAVDINGTHGKQVWRTGYGGGSEEHMDQMLIADWDPDNPGLEVNSVMSGPTFENPPGSVHHSHDILWYANQSVGGLGVILRENEDSPSGHAQSIYAGNWDGDTPGIETVFNPKGGPTPSGESWLTSTYSVDAQQRETSYDGCRLNIGQRATGPCGTFMEQIDWDGDRSADEILNPAWRATYVWRMGRKGDWMPGVAPSGMPTWAELQNENFLPGEVPFWWFYYQGDSGEKIENWGWPGHPDGDGVGRYTHYFEKLGEAYTSGKSRVRAFEVGKDYREEVVEVRPFKILVRCNRAPLADPDAYPSLYDSLDYRLARMHMNPGPFRYPDDPSGVGGEGGVVPEPHFGWALAAGLVLLCGIQGMRVRAFRRADAR